MKRLPLFSLVAILAFSANLHAQNTNGTDGPSNLLSNSALRTARQSLPKVQQLLSGTQQIRSAFGSDFASACSQQAVQSTANASSYSVGFACSDYTVFVDGIINGGRAVTTQITATNDSNPCLAQAEQAARQALQEEGTSSGLNKDIGGNDKARYVPLKSGHLYVINGWIQRVFDWQVVVALSNECRVQSTHVQ